MSARNVGVVKLPRDSAGFATVYGEPAPIDPMIVGGTHVNRSKKYKSNGERERARRQRQLAKSSSAAIAAE